ncbi:MAG: UbiD family decarboxylase [Chloroflexi bacterium]|nr:UbiD family decarboxylase [Chloroflexota bacterium]
MVFDDLRQFIEHAEGLGLCKTVEDTDWDLEIGAITELGLYVPEGPLLIFDKIKGYPAGYRVVTNFLNTPRLVALGFGLPPESKGLGQVQGWREKISEEFRPVPPVDVETGPVKENIHFGDDVDLFEFPVPKWHEHDGGRYIGTGHLVIQQDPDTGWVNVGTYRVQVHDKNTATIFMSPGKHGDEIRKKYWARGQSCPVAIVCGEDPLFWTMSHSGVPREVSEYDYVGWLRKKPIEVVRGEITNLPIPAGAEIVLEGEIVPPGTESRAEGPFGEWPGYYASGSRAEPAVKIKAVLHRNNPIILGAPPQLGPYDYYIGKNVMRAAIIWNDLDKNVPGVKGVWLPTEARGPNMIIVSIEQKYGGHAKQVASFLAGYYQSAFMLRFVIVVDDDIDPSNYADVLWALGTRCDPEKSIDILRECWATWLDPMLTPEKRAGRDLTHSVGIITACKPYSWKEQFPQAIKSSSGLLKSTREKWGKSVFGLS